MYVYSVPTLKLYKTGDFMLFNDFFLHFG